jgi:hypothetical protein
LLRDALVRVRAVVVHALHDRASALYRRFGLVPFQDDPLTLYWLVKDIRRARGGE